MLRNKFLSPILVFLLTPSAFALNLQSYHFSDSYRYSMLEDTLKEKFEGNYVFTASYGYVHTPFYYSDTYLHDLRGEIIDSNHVLTTGFTYYLNKNAAVGIDLSAVHNTVFDETHTTLGDTVLEGKFNIKRAETYSLSLNPQVILPTGQEENFSTVGSVGGALRLVGEKSLSERLHLLASVGAFSAKENEYVDVDHRQLLLTQLGVSYDVNDRMNVNFETYRRTPLVNDTLQDEGKYFATIKHKTHPRFSTYAGAGISAWGDVQRNTYSGFIGIKFHEPAPAAAAALATDSVSSGASAPKRLSMPSKNIYFAHDEYTLGQDDYERLDRYVDFFKDSDGIQQIIIEGFASSVGEPDYNMRLSQKRADEVKDYLIENGVRPDLVSTKAFGETAPQLPEEGMNRKVNFNIKK